jgi:hypothetical protein
MLESKSLFRYDADTVKNELPDKQMFKDLGIPNTDVEALFKQFLKNFNLNSKLE